MSFFEELKRRNVVRVAILYVVAGWVVLQIADVLFEPLGLPDWTFRMVLALLALGFPFALIFAWVFELTPDGLKREREVDRNASVTGQTGRKMNLVIVVLLVLAIAGLALDRLLPERSAPAEAAAPAMAGTAAPPTEAAAEPDNTIAVLPFVNMSGDPDNEYFSDGLTEELLNTLVRVGGLKVTGRTSSFAFKGRNIDLREIGQALNVANVLEGSVRKSGDRVRITAQLVKASDGYHLWSETFDRKLDDVFAIQEEIAEHVADALQVALLGDAERHGAVTAVRATIPAAYEQYLRGMYIWQRNPDGEEDLARAREHFEQAIALDPGYVDAYWGMFQVWDRMNRNGYVPFAESLDRMDHYVAELTRLDPDGERALLASARKSLVDFQYGRALAYLEEGVQRHPGNVDMLIQYASALNSFKRYREASEALLQAAQLDPLSLEVMRWQSYNDYRQGDCESAGAVMRRALEIEPGVGRVRYYYAMCLFETTGDAASALPHAEAEPLGFAHDTALAILNHALGDPRQAQAALDHMFVSYGDSAAFQYGQIHAQWGEVEPALVWLETALRIRDPGIIQAADDRLLSPLRGEPRFQQLLREAGF